MRQVVVLQGHLKVTFEGILTFIFKSVGNYQKLDLGKKYDYISTLQGKFFLQILPF